MNFPNYRTASADVKPVGRPSSWLSFKLSAAKAFILSHFRTSSFQNTVLQMSAQSLCWNLLTVRGACPILETTNYYATDVSAELMVEFAVLEICGGAPNYRTANVYTKASVKRLLIIVLRVGALL